MENGGTNDSDLSSVSSLLGIACLSRSLWPPFRKHCAQKKIIEDLFSEGLREVVAIDCVDNSWGIVFRAITQFYLSLSAFLLFL